MPHAGKVVKSFVDRGFGYLKLDHREASGLPDELFFHFAEVHKYHPFPGHGGFDGAYIGEEVEVGAIATTSKGMNAQRIVVVSERLYVPSAKIYMFDDKKGYGYIQHRLGEALVHLNCVKEKYNRHKLGKGSEIVECLLCRDRDGRWRVGRCSLP